MMQLRLPFPDIGPNIFAIDVFGREFALRYYAMGYIVGILIAWFMVVRFVRRPELWHKETPPMTSDQVADLVTWIILGVVLGGRLGYVLFYQPAYFAANPGDIIKVWEGGMAFHGGALGVLIAGLGFSLKNRLHALSVGDAIAAATPPAIFLVRCANFINAELWGRPSDLPWAVIFPGDAAQACATVEQLCARHPSQIYEALLEGLVLGLVMLWCVYRHKWFKTPGALIGLFLAGYGIARFMVEFVRQPDAQFTSETNPIGFALQFSEGLGLTMGQLLSLPMFIVGIAMIFVIRRKAE